MSALHNLTRLERPIAVPELLCPGRADLQARFCGPSLFCFRR